MFILVELEGYRGFVIVVEFCVWRVRVFVSVFEDRSFKVSGCYWIICVFRYDRGLVYGYRYKRDYFIIFRMTVIVLNFGFIFWRGLLVGRGISVRFL